MVIHAAGLTCAYSSGRISLPEFLDHPKNQQWRETLLLESYESSLLIEGMHFFQKFQGNLYDEISESLLICFFNQYSQKDRYGHDNWIFWDTTL